MILYCDGASRGNPGRSALGFVLQEEDGTIFLEEGRVLPVGTNNQAEYLALVAGLEAARKSGIKELLVRADSELMVRQVTGRYKVRNAGLLHHYQKVQDLVKSFSRIRFEHVPRSMNANADRLANEALDRKGTST
ncbi:MAG: ribonuclease HI family protein [Leptospirales bacterium]